MSATTHVPAGLRFELLAVDPATGARRGRLHTAHGTVETPVFMPVGTQGTVKALTPAQLHELGAEIILGNTYHLYLRPGVEVVEALGGLHRMAGWDRAILTDSGGFQVFSLRAISRITEEGVTFRSHVDGSRHLLTPEKAVEVQELLGSDIMMAFDECPPSGCDARRAAAAVDRTTRWARRCVDARRLEGRALFGIVQGALSAELRARSTAALLELPFDGYAIGGLSVGESTEQMHAVAGSTAALLPAGLPRYLMGVGTPEDLLACTGHGVDMFDCVLPTRNARNARMLTARGDYNLRNARHRLDDRPVDPDCGCYTCRHFSRGYLRHLDRAREMLFSTLASYHNLYYLLTLMAEARRRIEDGTFGPWRTDVLAQRRAGPP